jgi:hypothetical protein
VETLYPKVKFGGIIVFYRKYKRTIIVFSGLIFLLFIIGFSYGYITQMWGKRPPNEPVSPTPEVEQMNAEEDTRETVREVSTTNTDSVLVLERFYIHCQHTIADEMAINTSNIGKTGEELRLAYPSWELLEFSPEKVVFTVNIDGFCPNHYIIKEKDGYLVVYRSIKETGELYPVEDTSIPYDRLDAEAQEQVDAGLVVDTQEDVEHLMENWES